jgi:HAD superfamily hydrolase (TIGR01509 family)
MSYSAAVFDFDGTLFDTAECWRLAYESVSGRDISPEVMDALVGASAHAAARRLGEIFDERLSSAEIRIGLERAAVACPPAPLRGVSELLVFLRSRRIPMAVATNAPHRFVDVVLGGNLRPFFSAVVSSEDLGTSHDKPKPSTYEHACRLLGVDSRAAIAFEDSIVGATSAKAAGLALVFVNASGAEPPPVAHDLFLTTLQDRRLYEFLIP